MVVVRIVVGVVALATVSMQASIASAQPSPASPTDPVNSRFNEGMAAIRAGDYETALRAFADAYAIRPMPQLLFDLALCEEKTGRWLEALKHYKAVIEEKTAADQDRADARRHANALEAKVGHLDVRAPASAGIAIDGGPISATAPLPEPLAVPPGRHVVTVYLPAGVQSASVDTPAGQAVHVEFTPQVPPPSSVSRASIEPHAPEAGAPARRRAIPAARIAVSASLGALGLGSIGAGVYFAETSINNARNASNVNASLMSQNGSACHPPIPAANAGRCAALGDARDSQNRDAILSWVFYGAGGALAAGAIASWFFWPRTEAPMHGISVVPSVSRGALSVDVIGVF